MILQLLRDNQTAPISGEEISQKLGVSRTAVWKHIKTLKNEGHVIASKSKVGYCLLQSPDRIYPREITSQLDSGVLGKKLIYLPQTTSTNTIAKEAADSGAYHGTAIIAEKQQQGRGRLGKQWLSDNTKGIWMSVILRPDFPPFEAPKLTFMAAVALISAIKKTTGIELGLKWPNDVYYDNKKVAGILTEMKAEMDMIHYVVLGLGVNVNQQLTEMPEEIRELAISLRAINKGELCRTKLTTAILKELEHWYEIFVRDGFKPILEEWRQWDVTKNQQVQVKEWDNDFLGTAQGVDNEGNLLVLDEQGVVHPVHSGEVSIKIKT